MQRRVGRDDGGGGSVARVEVRIGPVRCGGPQLGGLQKELRVLGRLLIVSGIGRGGCLGREEMLMGGGCGCLLEEQLLLAGGGMGGEQMLLLGGSGTALHEQLLLGGRGVLEQKEMLCVGHCGQQQVGMGGLFGQKSEMVVLGGGGFLGEQVGMRTGGGFAEEMVVG